MSRHTVLAPGGIYLPELIINQSNPIFNPKKHTVESYRSQQRKAKKRRNNKSKN
jgi:hypothetical protein